MKITNLQLKQIQTRLKDIRDNIVANMEILSDEKLSDTFLRPILTIAIQISDEVFIQTKDNINEVEILKQK